MSLNYWENRIVKQQEALYDKTLSEVQKQLSKEYQRTLWAIQSDMEKLYEKLILGAVDGKVQVNDLYKFDRFYKLQAQINGELVKLGKQEVFLNTHNFDEMYRIAGEVTLKGISKEVIRPSFVIFEEGRAKRVINSVWCSDGKNWSSRIWTNKKKLKQRIEEGLIDCVERGVSKDALVERLISDFEVGFSQADCIARTELTYVQGQACGDRYRELGAIGYRYLAAIDSRTSKECKQLNGKKFLWEEMKVGKNYPPAHARCRSTVTAEWE